MSKPPATHPRSRLIVGLLLCALLTMQSLGQWHRVVHAQGHGDVATLKAQAGYPSIGKLFAAHHGDEDCRAFDQAGLADLVFGAPPTLVELAPTALVLAPLRGTQLPLQATAYRARAPPASA